MAEDTAPLGPAEQAELARLRGRVAELEAERGGDRRHRGRSFLAVVLIVIGCILAPLGIVASWAADTVGDTDRYVATVAPLASNPDIQKAVATRATNEIMTRIDLQSLLSEVPTKDRPLVEKSLGKLGDSLEGAVRSFVQDKAQAVVASDAFENIWKQTNRTAHSSLMKALTGSGGGSVKVEGDTVTLDLGPLVEQVKQRLVDSGLTVAGRIPEVHTDFTLVTNDNIGKAKTYLRLLQVMGNWLPVIALVLVAAGVLLSVRRRRSLVATALAVAVSCGLLGIGLRVFRVVYLDRLPASVSQDAAAAVYDTMTHFLFTMVRMVVALGVIVALAAWLTGRGKRAGVVRGLWISGIDATRLTADRAGFRTGPVGPFVRHYRTWIVWILLAGALLVYLLWSYPTGWVVVGIALCLLFLLAVVEFLAAEGVGDGPPTPTTV
ncbi:hypothetical protein [Streptomyces endophyticus]|uniref:Integral membrane protein n=1 Tax=Streptomyces endophyticus TaxID=714166 RepID=A0ABU6F575_9ACTN|nr:hypothetical protein [Streptomyces endophyticus]MEB8339155.1 hypothetical protein [Streptomyces endophyticus]